MKLFGKSVELFHIIFAAIGTAIVLLVFFLGILPNKDSVWAWIGFAAFLLVGAFIAIPPFSNWLIGLFRKK